MRDARLFDAALLALGGGLMLLGGSHATRGEDHRRVSPGPAALTVVGMGVMVYAAYRIKPSAGAALGAVLLTVAFINEHRRSLGMPDLVPGIALPGAEARQER
ncbi:MAG TPA: hypothetical protein VMN82_04965 [Thermoanaerobaculia bacterium]|nr:hypothetical protein [Thermoanaerobaculia bacterium]